MPIPILSRNDAIRLVSVVQRARRDEKYAYDSNPNVDDDMKARRAEILSEFDRILAFAESIISN